MTELLTWNPPFNCDMSQPPSMFVAREVIEMPSVNFFLKNQTPCISTYFYKLVQPDMIDVVENVSYETFTDN